MKIVALIVKRFFWIDCKFVKYLERINKSLNAERANIDLFMLVLACLCVAECFSRTMGVHCCIIE